MIEKVEAELEVLIEKSFTHYPSKRPEPEIEVVREAARLLEKAKKPVIVARIIKMLESIKSLKINAVIADHHQPQGDQYVNGAQNDPIDAGPDEHGLRSPFFPGRSYSSIRFR